MAAKMAEVLSADPSPCTSCWTLAEAGEADGWLALQSVYATHVGLRGWHHPRPSRWVGLRVHVEAQHQGHSQVCGWLCLLPLNHVDAAVWPLRRARGSDWIAAQKAGCDVLSFGWLERCYAEGTRVHPWPSEYLQISDATLQVC